MEDRLPGAQALEPATKYFISYFGGRQYSVSTPAPAHDAVRTSGWKEEWNLPETDPRQDAPSNEAGERGFQKQEQERPLHSLRGPSAPPATRMMLPLAQHRHFQVPPSLPPPCQGESKPIAGPPKPSARRQEAWQEERGPKAGGPAGPVPAPPAAQWKSRGDCLLSPRHEDQASPHVACAKHSTNVSCRPLTGHAPGLPFIGQETGSQRARGLTKTS